MTAIAKIYDALNEVSSSRLLHELKYYAISLSPKFKELFVVGISDVHRGDPLSSEKHFENTIKVISEVPNLYCFFNGDLCNSVIPDSLGDIWLQQMTPRNQKKYFIEKLKPIKNKILCMTDGNHEKRIYRKTSEDITADIAEALNVPYRPNGIAFKISFGGGNSGHDEKPYTYYNYATHGYGGARTRGAKAVKVERLTYWLTVDVYWMSHDHEVNIGPSIYLYPDNRTFHEKDDDGNETGFEYGNFIAKRRMPIKTNAYLKWGGYSEERGYAPTDLTTPIVRFKGTGKPGVSVIV